MNKYKSLTLGIDATNLSGGCKHYLLELLKHAAPISDGFKRIVLWAPMATLDALPDYPWLIKSHHPIFEKNFWFRGLWQWRHLSREARKHQCDLLFIPGGAYIGDFEKVVVMYQNILPFEQQEINRYWTVPSVYIKFSILYRLYKRMLSRASGIIFLTEEARAKICATTGDTPRVSTVIPHGIDPSFKSVERHHRSIEDCHPSDPFRLLYVSAIDFYKHPWQVVETVAVLRAATGWPLKLILAGPVTSDVALARLQSAMRRFDPAGSFVEYLGEVPHADMPSLYASADMAVFASTCENLPMIVLEKMAMGLPIACSEYPAMRALLGEDAAWFDPASIASVAEALRALISDPLRRAEISQHNRSKAAAYDWDRVTRETFKFLRGRVGA